MENCELEEILSDEQAKALAAVQSGKSIFITGSAGVGKSFLLNKIIKNLPATIGVTASTGVAACNIGGTTLHSFAGIGLGDKPMQQLVRMVQNKQDTRRRWQNTKVLVVDEISMIDGLLFDKIEEVARLVRGVQRPFGGMQVILCGDFLQLPPVHVQRFAFESSSWKKLIDEVVVLKKVFRQKNIGFVALLNRLRYGQITSLDIEVLHLCSKTLFPDDGIKPTRLYPHRWRVEKDNKFELNKLPGKSHHFPATDWAKYDKFREQLEKNCKFPKELELKVGAQVMLLVNKAVASGLVNGSRGVVIGFDQKKFPMESDDDQDDFVQYPIVRFVNGVELKVNVEKLTLSVNGNIVAWRLQVPLLLAWAVSIHKSQGMTLERVEVDIAAAFEHGQAYVALSRVTGLDGLRLRDFNPGRITAHPKVVQYYRQLDPTFEESMKLGLNDLKEFIKQRNDYETYKKSVEEQVPSCCTSDTDYEHNYHRKTDLLNTHVKMLRVSHDNELESPGKSNYVRVNGTCRRQSFSAAEENSVTIQNSQTINSTVSHTKTMFENTKSSDTSTTPDLTRVEQIARKCRTMLNEIHQVNIPTKNDKLDVVVVRSDDDDDEVQEKSIRRSSRFRGKKRKSYVDMVDDGSDSPISPAPFQLKKSESDVVTNETTPVGGCKQSSLTDVNNPETTVKENPNFMSMICPDLLVMSQNVTDGVNKKKIRMEEKEAERIRTLLKEKDAQIQEKRRKALQKRRLSLQRNGGTSTLFA